MDKYKLAVLLAVRNWSDRLPGKALAEVCNRPVLAHILDRYRLASDRARYVVVATSTLPDDDPIAALCRDEGVPCHRSAASVDGNVTRLLDEALHKYADDADYVLRGMCDCPLAEPSIICDWMTDVLQARGGDVVWVGLPDDPWPIYGARESPFSRAAWDRCVQESRGRQLQHPGLYVYEKLCDFRVIHTQPLRYEYYRPYRLELDTDADLRVTRAVYEALWQGPGHVVSMLDAIKWLDAHPEVAALNADVELKSITVPEWKRRGAIWSCKECGASPMETRSIRHGRLETVCFRCGASRFFELKEYRQERTE